MNRSERTNQRRLEEARATVQALASGQVDLVAGASGPVLLAAAEALHAAEARYRVLLDSAPDAMVVFNDRGEIQMLNGRTQELFGATREDLVGRSIQALVSDEVWAAHAEHLEDFLHRPRALRLGVDERIHCRRADNSEFPAEISLSPVQTQEGTYLIAAIRDVGARVATEDALRDSEAKLASTLNSIGDGVLATDLQGAVTLMNPVAEQLTGFSHLEAVGHRVDEIYRVCSEKTREPMATPIADLAVGVAAVAPHARLVARDGHQLLISQCAAPIRKPTGEVVGVVVAFRDVTAQKELQEQLLLSDRMVSLGTLAAGVAHEINNPLAALIGNLDVLMGELTRKPREVLLPASVDDVLHDIREAAEQVRLIVKDLKLFSRGDEESRGPVDVQRLLDSSARLARNEVRHRARLVKDWQPVPAVIANEARLGEVFVNLIVNAAQAIPEGRADDNEIRLTTRVADRGRVAIEIRDSGVGIPPEILGRIFDPFFTTKPIGVGTGLGLSICHRIVSELGGEITVESPRGRGTCFRVLLPAVEAGRATRHLPATREERKGRRASVLVIDDEALVRAFVERALTGEHEVTVEACAEDGLLRIENGQRFDVILCDVMMPQMTGIEFYQVLSVIEPDQAARVGFITGGAFTGGTQRFLDSAPNPKLEKPFRVDRLRSFVDSVLDRAEPHEPAQPPLALPRLRHHA